LYQSGNENGLPRKRQHPVTFLIKALINEPSFSENEALLFSPCGMLYPKKKQNGGV
jgi:hypothetical protein